MARLAGRDIDTPWPGCRYTMAKIQIHKYAKIQIHYGQDEDTLWLRYGYINMPRHRYNRARIQLGYTTVGTQYPHYHNTQTEIHTDTTEQVQPPLFLLLPKKSARSVPLCYHRHIHNIWCAAPFLALQDHSEIRGGLGLKCKFDLALQCVIQVAHH